MKAIVRSGIMTLACIALLACTGLPQARTAIRIDGSSDSSVRESFTHMMESLDDDGRMRLQSAILQLNMAGISSAKEMLADPELRNPGPVRIKSRIAGLSSTEIIALADRTSEVRVVVGGQEPGVPTELMTPLGAGHPAHALTSTRWRLTSTINGHVKELTLQFEQGGLLTTEPPSTAGVSRWEQSAYEVRIVLNDRYAVYRGRFIDADHMKGAGGNKMGSTWTWTAERL